MQIEKKDLQQASRLFVKPAPSTAGIGPIVPCGREDKNMLMRTVVAASLFMLCVSYALAEERLGVAVYPGAKYDQARTELLRNSLSVQGAAYRTGDDVATVVAFYRKQGLQLLKTGSPSKEHARFRKSDTGVDVVVESMRKDPRAGADVPETLIQIFKKEEKQGRRSDTSI